MPALPLKADICSGILAMAAKALEQRIALGVLSVTVGHKCVGGSYDTYDTKDGGRERFPLCLSCPNKICLGRVAGDESI